MESRRAPVTWFGIAVAGMTAAAGLGLALIVVLRTRESDILAVVALVLAVVSLLSQLMVALAQFFAAAQQHDVNAELTRQTQTALAEIRSLTADLSQRLAFQVERLMGLDAASSPPRALVEDGTDWVSGLVSQSSNFQDRADESTVYIDDDGLQQWLRSRGLSEVVVSSEAAYPYVSWRSEDGETLIAAVVSSPRPRRERLEQIQRLVAQLSVGGEHVSKRFVVASFDVASIDGFEPDDAVAWVRADQLERLLAVRS